MTTKLKRNYSLAAYVVTVVLIFLVFSELTARALKLAPPLGNEFANMAPDTYLPFKPRPNSSISGRSKFDEFDYHIEINSVGLRDFERPYTKPKDTFRILGLGDSTTYGGAVLLEDSYLRLVEIQLNERSGDHPDIEIIKAGVPRFYTKTERMMLEHYGVRYEPDLITVGFGNSDVIDTLHGLNATIVDDSGNVKSKEFDEISPIGMFFFKHSHVARVFLNEYVKAKSPQPIWDEIYKPNGIYEEQWQEVEREFNKMAEISRSIEATLVIIYIPDFTVFTRGEEQLYPPERLQSWANRNDVIFVDVTPAMLAAGETSNGLLFFARDRHPTPAGYKVIADTVYEVLTSKGLVP